jgi:hypothetical protein
VATCQNEDLAKQDLAKQDLAKQRSGKTRSGKTKAPGGWNGPDRRAPKLGVERLEKPQHNRADKGYRDIRGNNAQPAGHAIGGHGTKGHSKPPGVHDAARTNAESNHAFRVKKVSLVVHP